MLRSKLTFILVLALSLAIPAGAVSFETFILGGPAYANLTFVKIPLPKSNMTNCSDSNFNNFWSTTISPSTEFDTVQVTWDEEENNNVQNAGIGEGVDVDGFQAMVCWVANPFTLYVGYGFWNNTWGASAYRS